MVILLRLCDVCASTILASILNRIGNLIEIIIIVIIHTYMHTLIIKTTKNNLVVFF